MKFISVLLFCTIIFGCEKPDLTSNEFKLNDTLDLNAQIIYHNNDNGISIYLDSVLYDTRCPLGFLCLWEGNAKIRFKFISNHNSSDLILNTYSQFRTDTVVNGYKITLISLAPSTKNGVKIEQIEYRATILINN